MEQNVNFNSNFHKFGCNVVTTADNDIIRWTGEPHFSFIILSTCHSVVGFKG